MPDLYRLRNAAHELGHAIAFHHARIPILAIRLEGHGHHGSGYCDIDDDHITNDQRRGLLIGILAGEEAAVRWCLRRGIDSTFGRAGCDDDHTLLAQFRKHPTVRHVPLAVLRAETRHLIHEYGPRIDRLTPKLAAHGSITL